MKKVIENLLKSIKAGATHSIVAYHTRFVRRAFDAGAFDCLVEHSPDEPPDTERDVLCLVGYKFPGAELRWRVSRFVRYWKCGDNVHAWRELPPGAHTEKQ